MPIATGETRQITKWFANGWFNCPWCGAANPPDTQHCDNPACWASKYATAESVRADQDRIAREAAEREQRHRDAATQAATQEQYQQQRTELWQQRIATATERGAYLTYLRVSTQPFTETHHGRDRDDGAMAYRINNVDSTCRRSSYRWLRRSRTPTPPRAASAHPCRIWRTGSRSPRIRCSVSPHGSCSHRGSPDSPGGLPVIYLGGTIAPDINWQADAIAALATHPVVIANPRREQPTATATGPQD